MSLRQPRIRDSKTLVNQQSAGTPAWWKCGGIFLQRHRSLHCQSETVSRCQSAKEGPLFSAHLPIVLHGLSSPLVATQLSAGRVMKLRDHPLMTRKSGIRSWPPTWTSARLAAAEGPIGEVGTLQQALLNNLMSTRIFLLINYQGSRYMGSMAFDNPEFCSEIYAVLNSHVGCSIKEIGDLDLSYTL
jgi:hypothetical protein